MADKIFMLQDALRLVMARGKMLPSTKPRYRLLEELANGGFSQVWLARDLESKTRYVDLAAHIRYC